MEWYIAFKNDLLVLLVDLEKRECRATNFDDKLGGSAHRGLTIDADGAAYRHEF